MVPGHEGAGIVEAVGEGVTHVVPGDHGRVLLRPVVPIVPGMPGRPVQHVRAGGRERLEGMLMDGTSRLRLQDGTTLQHGLMTACFAERTVVAANSAVPIPEALPLWQAALLGCGVMTGFGAVRNVAAVAAGESVVVIGCGGVGLQVLAAARARGRRSADRGRPRRGQARAGAPPRSDARSRLRDRGGGRTGGAS